MPGFGGGPFGNGGFGQWDWLRLGFVNQIPTIYKAQDEEVGQGRLTSLLYVVGQSLDGLRRKIRDYDELRDPLLCPTQNAFTEAVIIIGVTNLGDGTSRVFLSQGATNTVFNGIRIGMVLTDSTGQRFNITEVHSSGLPGDFSNPPIDPNTNAPSGKYIIVSNLSQGITEVIPAVSGPSFTEKPSPNGVFVSPPGGDNGINLSPYVFRLLLPVVPSATVTLSWTETSVAKTGSFDVMGNPSGDLALTSSIAFGDPTIITMRTLSANVVDASSISVSYMSGATPIVGEEPSRGAFVAPPGGDDGTNLPPYVFVLLNPPLARNIVGLTWTDSVNGLTDGAFNNDGSVSGDLGLSSAIDYASGTITLYPKDGGVISANTIEVTYKQAVWANEVAPGVPPSDIGSLPFDATIESQNILAFLASDYGVAVDRHDPDVSQRDMVWNAYQLWDLKGVEDGYKFMGLIAGFRVVANPLYEIDSAYVSRLDPDQVFEFPIGSGHFFTPLDPRRPSFEEIAADDIPLDVFTFDPAIFPTPPPAGYPTEVQAVTATAVTFQFFQGNNLHYKVVVTALNSVQSLGITPGYFVDNAGHSYPVENYQRLTATSYQFEVTGQFDPVVGVGVVNWKTPTWSLTVQSVIDFGPQYAGFAGHRYKLRLVGPIAVVTLPSIGIIGNWAFIDSNAYTSWVEQVDGTGTVGMQYYMDLEIVSDHAPVTSTSCQVFYVSDVLPGCDFCKASAIRFLMTPLPTIDPSQLAEDALGRLVSRLEQMVPAHVRITSFVYDPGPATTDPLELSATSIIIEHSNKDGLVGAYYDVIPADDIETDPPGYLGSVDTTIDFPTAPWFEENVDSHAPLLDGWAATGFWQVANFQSLGEQYDHANAIVPLHNSETGRFVYGLYDPGTNQTRLDLGPLPNNGSLTSPLIAAIGSASSVLLQFGHYGNMGSGNVDFLPGIDILDSSNVVLQTFSKFQVDPNLSTSGTTIRAIPDPSPRSSPPDWAAVTLDITTAVVGAGQFRIRFTFDTVTNAISSAYEGWYIDNVKVVVS